MRRKTIHIWTGSLYVVTSLSLMINHHCLWTQTHKILQNIEELEQL